MKVVRWNSDTAAGSPDAYTGAIVFDAFGPPHVLRPIRLAAPHAGPGEVRVRVKAAGVQPFDTALRAGRMSGSAAAFLEKYVAVEFPQCLGNEFAGIVDEVGTDVAGVAPGDAVIGWSVMNSYAECVVVSADRIVGKPPAMPWDEAGALSASGQTAHTALRALGIGVGDTLLVHAAAGGVGSIAVQLARAWGARVIGTASARNHDFLRELGAEPVAYGPGLVERVRRLAPHGVSAALDAYGGEAFDASLKLVDDWRRIATLVEFARAAKLGALAVRSDRSAARLGELTAAWERGALRVPIRERYALHNAAQAHRDVEYGHGRGKVVLMVEVAA